MELNDLIHKLRKHLKRNIISLLTIPVLFFLIVFTYFGNEIQPQILNNSNNFSFFEINTYKNQLQNNPLIPLHVKSFVNVMVIYTMMIFYYYLVLFMYSCYKKHAENHFNTTGIVEFIVLLIIQVVVISPGIHFFYKIIGYLPFLIVFGIAITFKLYFLKLLHEKK